MPSQVQLDTQLLMACRKRELEEAEDAVSQGANPNAIAPGKCHETMRNALSRAIEYDAPDIVSLLVRSGADINESNEKDSAYHERLCRLINKPDCLISLLETGAVLPQRRHMEWALEWKHKPLTEYLKAQGKTTKPICYDVDAILALGDPTAILSSLSARLPEAWSKLARKLNKPEIVARDIWDFHVSIGSCFGSVVSNGDFECIHRAEKALAQLPPTNASRALQELEELLRRFGFPRRHTRREDYLARAGDQFERDLDALDQKWFSGDDTLSLWKNCEYLDAAVDHIRAHIKTLRKRNVEQDVDPNA